jgi:hypothetical protein
MEWNHLSDEDDDKQQIPSFKIEVGKSVSAQGRGQEGYQDVSRGKNSGVEIPLPVRK